MLRVFVGIVIGQNTSRRPPRSFLIPRGGSPQKLLSKMPALTINAAIARKIPEAGRRRLEETRTETEEPYPLGRKTRHGLPMEQNTHGWLGSRPKPYPWDYSHHFETRKTRV